MPVYLIHGFRWIRKDVREYIIINNIDDAAPEWIIAPRSSVAILSSFRKLYPAITDALPSLRLLEQFDLDDETVASQPYAYVADVVHQVKLGIDIDEIQGKGFNDAQRTALVELKDKVCRRGAHISWYIVVCADEHRLPPPSEPPVESPGYREFSGNGYISPSQSETKSMSSWKPEASGRRERSNSFTRGIRRMFSGSKDLRKSRSLKDLRNPDSGYYSSSDIPPELPGTAR